MLGLSGPEAVANGQHSQHDLWMAYCLDEAAYLWGTHVETAIAEAGRKARSDDPRFAAARRMREFESLMTDPETSERFPKGKFRDPASLAAKEA